MKTHSPNGLKRFYADTPWQSGAHRVWFTACAACLAAYTAYITYLPYSGFLKTKVETVGASVCFLGYGAALFAFFLWACRRLAQAAPKARPVQSRLDRRVFAVCAVISLAVLGSAFLKCYPGGVSYDAANQWRQAETGEFNQWHPVFHTLLIWLATRVCNRYAFAVLAQIVAFSLAQGYLFATLRRYGVPAWLAIAVSAVTVISEPVRNTMMYLWKDNAMTIGCLVLCAQSVGMIATKGGWLKKPLNAAAFGLALAYTTLVRHNTVLFTLPLLCLAVGCYPGLKKQKLTAAGTFGLCLLLVQGALFGALDVVYPSNTTEEAVGLPMAILGNAKLEAPQALDEETNAFLNTLATDEEWRQHYSRSDYNSIKFTYPREYIKYTPAADILFMAAKTAARAPRLAFETVNEVTDLVWDVSGQNEGYETVSNSGDLLEAAYGDSRLHGLGRALTALMDAPLAFLPLSWLCRNIGAQLLLLLLVSLWALYRGGIQKLTLAVPVLCYDLATMLLLCGQDARFFSFTMAVSLPAMLALLYAPGGRQGASAPCTPDKG